MAYTIEPALEVQLAAFTANISSLFWVFFYIKKNIEIDRP